MRRHLFAILAVIWAALTIAVALESFGVDTVIGLQAHIIPATFIYSALDSMNLTVDLHGPLVRSAHSPLFLGPLGVVICYLLPTLVFVILSLSVRRPKPGPPQG